MANRRRKTPKKRDEHTTGGGLLGKTRNARNRSNPRRRSTRHATDSSGSQPKLKPQAKARKKSKNRVTIAAGPVYREAMAVALWCAGLMTCLALGSYDAQDASLNASSSSKVQNLIGPAGAYWSDLLLQLFGVGSYALGMAFLLAGWRAALGRRIRPTFREASGIALLTTCLGSFWHLLLAGKAHPYPPGGVAGAVLGEQLLIYFAKAGSFILSGALCLVAAAITADGVLTGLGLRGLGAFRGLWLRLEAWWTALRTRRAILRKKREQMRLEEQDLPNSEHWTLGPTPNNTEEQGEEAVQGIKIGPSDATRAFKLQRARERGQAQAAKIAKRRQQRHKAKALRPQSEPEIAIHQPIDLDAEEQAFELGEVPLDLRAELPPHMPMPPTAEFEQGVQSLDRPPTVELDPEDVEELRPEIPIRAANDDDALTLGPVGAQQELRATPSGNHEAPQDKNSSGAQGESAPEIVDVRPEVDLEAIEKAAQEEPPSTKSYALPSPTLLDFEAAKRAPIDSEQLKQNAQRLTQTLRHYGIEGQVREIRPGPIITMYEYVPAPGIKISKIANLADDLAMSMEALRVRIVAPIPGKGAVGIEIPNAGKETVYLKEIITHDNFRKSTCKLPIALGKDIEGNPRVSDLTKMPHLLVAGATGAGKSVSVNAMIMSFLFEATPEDVRLIMVDPKMLELSVYDGIPHLLLPVVTDPKKASLALRWGVDEMERRYKLLSGLGVRNIAGYNAKVQQAKDAGQTLTITTQDKAGRDEQLSCEHLPFIVIIVDELADLMMVASREVEASIMRLAQMARAAGIHLILATQRPSVDVLTGVIKANFPTRIAFQVASKHDSRTILDSNGAEHLLGQGDMLFLSPGAQGMHRVHGSFVSDEEIERTVNFLKSQGEPEYDESILAPRDEGKSESEDEDAYDELYDQALAIVAETQQASISMIQRRLRIGYNRAARLVECMEREGVVGPADGAKPRAVLIPPLGGGE